MKRAVILWIKKIGFSVLVVFIVMTATFFLMHFVKGDPFTSSIERVNVSVRQQYIERYGLDKSIGEQYIIFLKRLFFCGDMGTSMINKSTTVNDVVRLSLGTSIVLGGSSVIIGTIIGCVIGAVAGYSNKRSKKLFLSVFCMLGISLPVFVWAPMLQSVFGCNLNLFPISGWGSISHFILPVICMLPNTIATTMKYSRNSVEKIRTSDFYILLKQRGLSENYIFRKHIIRNSLPAIISVLVSSLSGVFTGAFIVEKIFSIPGIGRQFMYAVTMRDYTIIIGLNLVFTIVYEFFRLLGDLIQELCNPSFGEK